jgi:hypothetical protein
VPERFQPVLKIPKTLNILARNIGQRNRRGFEKGIDPGFAGFLKLPECSFKLFSCKRADFGRKQHHENVTLADSPVVLILQPGFGHGVDEIFPDHQLDEPAIFVQRFVSAADELFEFLAIIFQLTGRGEENFYGSRHRIRPPSFFGFQNA